ncbi:hypothetical protein [Micromonospora zamorensis]|uniref:hypothetical protein n=1 Tax=Micromonospora zamorensis TaxID=709883 RepID=UPI00379E7842
MRSGSSGFELGACGPGPRVAHAEDHVLGGLPEDQRDAFRDFAARAAEAIHAAAPATDPCVAVRSVLPQTEQSDG